MHRLPHIVVRLVVLIASTHAEHRAFNVRAWLFAVLANGGAVTFRKDGGTMTLRSLYEAIFEFICNFLLGCGKCNI